MIARPDPLALYEALVQKQLAEQEHLNIFKLELKEEFTREREMLEQDRQTYINLSREIGHIERDFR